MSKVKDMERKEHASTSPRGRRPKDTGGLASGLDARKDIRGSASHPQTEIVHNPLEIPFPETREENLAELVFHRFTGRKDDCAIQEADGSYKRAGGPLDAEVIKHHLTGDVTLATYVLDERGEVNFLCLDVDGNPQDKGTAQRATRRLLEELLFWGFPPLVEFSGNKGYHIWVLLDRPLPAQEGISFMRYILRLSGFQEVSGRFQKEEFPGVHVELYPKSAAPGGKGLGCAIKLPLGKHNKSGRFSFFCDHDFKEVEDPTSVLSTLPAPGTTDRIRRLLKSPRVSFSLDGGNSRSSSIQEIRRRISIEDLLEELSGKTVKRLKEKCYTTHCVLPGHEDHTPSLTIYPEEGRFICGGCGKRGDIFDAYMVFREVDFATALLELGVACGVDVLPSPSPNKGFKTFTLRELLSGDCPTPEYIVEKILIKGGSAMIYGKEKIGKTFLATQLALCIASGTPFLEEYQTKRTRVAYLSTDMIIPIFKERLKQVCTQTPCWEACQEDLIFLDDIPKLDEPHVAESLLRILQKDDIGVLIVDTLSSSMQGDENSTKDMGKVIDTIRLLNRHEISVLLIHHEGKGEGKGARGSSSLGGAIDSILHFRVSGDLHILSFKGLRFSRPIKDIALEFDGDMGWFRPSGKRVKTAKCSPEDVISVLTPFSSYCQKELIEMLVKRCDCSASTAKQAIKDAKNRRLIKVVGDKDDKRKKFYVMS